VQRPRASQPPTAAVASGEALARLGPEVRAAREALGLSIEEAAERMEIDARHLRRIEASESDVRVGSLLRIARGLGVSGSVLLARAEALAPRAVVERSAQGATGEAQDLVSAGPERVAANVVALRRGKRLTQSELAEKAGLSLFTVQSIERGRHAATLRSLTALARALDISPAALHAEHAPTTSSPKRVRKPSNRPALP
jgi:transcriptional regulator with XRE-family HTH domain